MPEASNARPTPHIVDLNPPSIPFHLQLLLHYNKALATMESIEGKFIIEVDGQPVAMPENSDEPRIHASLGPTSPAVFTLVDGYLKSRGWILGRALVEDRSLLPKKIFWFNEQESDLGLIQKTRAVSDGNSFVLGFAG